MKNKLTDLNNHLFAQLERINDEGLTGDDMTNELERTKAVIGLGKEIVSNARLALDAEKFKAEYQGVGKTMPEMLERKERRD